jgi:hypothetical protein
MSATGGSQDAAAATAVGRSNRNNKGVDYGSSMEVIEESDGDEDLEGQVVVPRARFPWLMPVESIPTAMAIWISTGHRRSPGGASEDGGGDENTESSVSLARNVDRTLVWERTYPVCKPSHSRGRAPGRVRALLACHWSLALPLALHELECAAIKVEAPFKLRLGCCDGVRQPGYGGSIIHDGPHYLGPAPPAPRPPPCHFSLFSRSAPRSEEEMPPLPPTH